MLCRPTLRWLRRIHPEDRLAWAVRLFWLSIIGGALSTAFLCRNGFERVLMAISWFAITITCVDVVLTADVRAETGGESS